MIWLTGHRLFADPLKLTGCGAGFVEPCTHPDPDILLAKHARELSDDQILSNFQQLKGKFHSKSSP